MFGRALSKHASSSAQSSDADKAQLSGQQSALQFTKPLNSSLATSASKSSNPTRSAFKSAWNPPRRITNIPQAPQAIHRVNNSIKSGPVDICWNEEDFDEIDDVFSSQPEPETKAEKEPSCLTSKNVEKPVPMSTIRTSVLTLPAKPEISTTERHLKTTLAPAKEPWSTFGTQLSWSPSPPSHYQPSTVSRPGPDYTSLAPAASCENSGVQSNPIDLERRNSDQSLKRSSPDSSDPIVLPMKKKPREIPPEWETEIQEPPKWQKIMTAKGKMSKQVNKPTNSRVDVPRTPARPPGESKHGDYPWDQTASGLKAQQKKHREAKKSDKAKVEAVVSAVKPASNNKAKDKKIVFSEEQKHVLKLVVDHGKSVFFTGSAGTGKSVLLREIIKNLKKKHHRDSEAVAVTASTGLAACNIGGVTLHSYAGIGLGKEEIPELVRRIRRNAKAKERWMKTKVLVIDEISMVDGDLFDKLEGIARAMRKNQAPFGGIKLIITGDFFQLPPVPDQGKLAKFAFHAAKWVPTLDHTIRLTHVFRQKDAGFAAMLNEMRLGHISDKTVAAFRNLSRPVIYADGIEPTELFSTRGEVENSNGNRMRSLSGEAMTFEARDGGTMTDIQQRNKLLSNCMAPTRLELKKGAQVMLIKNIDEFLVNGSIGKIIGFMDENTYSLANDIPSSLMSQAAEAGWEGSDEEYGRGGNPKLKSITNYGMVGTKKWPLVRFALADGTSRDLLCQAEIWKVELPNGEVQASRSQVPLILAWALSIHKAQGQTLERVKVNLGRVFEKGQAYVALSRATSQAGLQVLNFDRNKVMAHPTVAEFYKNLSDASEVAAQAALNKGKTEKSKGQIKSAAALREIKDNRKMTEFAIKIDDDDVEDWGLREEDGEERERQSMFG